MINQPFEITKIIFEHPENWENISNADKRKFYFVINRRFAIQYPMQANALQHIKINQAGAIDFWKNFLSKQYNRTPSWMYIKGVKKAKVKKEAKTNISEKLIDEYAKYIQMDKKSVIDALNFFPDKIKKEIKLFEKIISKK